MTVDERARHQLHNRLEQAIGAEDAAVLMSYLPPVGWADVATKQDLVVLRSDLTVLRSELGRDIEAVRTELHQSIAGQTRQFFFGMVAIQATFATLLFAGAQLFG